MNKIFPSDSQKSEGFFIQNKKFFEHIPSPVYGERSGDAVLNDSPVDCQTRGVTEPQREGCRVGSLFQIHNYTDIGNINITKQNSSTREASPSRFTGGGARGWVPLEGAQFYRFSTGLLSKSDLTDLINEGIPPTSNISPNPMRSKSGASIDATIAPTIAPIVPPIDIRLTAP